jgi:hypothetical protein
MSQHVTSFSWKDFKNFPFGMSQHFIYDPYLSRSGNGLSRYVTGKAMTKGVLHIREHTAELIRLSF